MPLLRGVLTVGQLAKKLGISTSTLKAWEKAGYIPKAKRALLTKTRIWNEAEVGQIIEFMRQQ